MLDKDALAQLRQLKHTIVSTKAYATGTVRGSSGRYGFVRCDDGADIYLSAEEMQKVFPDDRVKIEVIEQDGRKTGVIEQLLESPLQTFTGSYIVRDTAHFVEADLPRMNRWLFVPPKSRSGAAHGDWVRARVLRHPFRDGKPQVELLEVIGNSQQPDIASAYAIARHQVLPSAAEVSPAELATPDIESRPDFTHLPFVTIDGADTRDMDDALCAAADGDGWTLWVAVADPDAWLIPGSALEQAAAERGQSTYLPGRTLSMLPESLAHDRCSLVAGEQRLALVVSLAIANDGSVTNATFSEGRIRSRAKLAYDDVAAFLDRGETLPDGADAAAITTLAAAATALHGYRQRHNLVMRDRPDYRFVFDAEGRVTGIQRCDKNSAQQLVEDCMIATNRAAAEFLADTTAVFVGHAGLRQERREPLTALLQGALPALAGVDLATLEGYVDAVRACVDAVAPGGDVPLHAILVRSLERSQLSLMPQPHFGMGLPRYTTITSPIRRWSDLLGHRAIKAKLRGDAAPAISTEQLEALQLQNDGSRQASNLAEQWLRCEFLASQPKGPYAGTIGQVNSRGFTVRLDDTGIDGFVELPRDGEKFSFDAAALTLSSPSRSFRLEQPVQVVVESIDTKRRSIKFALHESADDPAANHTDGLSHR